MGQADGRAAWYARFGAQGGDWSTFVAAQLGHKYADRVIGVHLHFPVKLGPLFGVDDAQAEDYTPEEAGYPAANAKTRVIDAGYYILQSTKPQTVAALLEDSPAGLLAWIAEKRRSWSDCNGDLERRFSKDDLLTGVTLYWLTQSAGSAARFYYENSNNPWQASHGRMPAVEAPALMKLITTFPLERSDNPAVSLRTPPGVSEARQRYYDRCKDAFAHRP